MTFLTSRADLTRVRKAELDQAAQTRLDSWLLRASSAKHFGEPGEPATEPVTLKNGQVLSAHSQNMIVARILRDRDVMASDEAVARPEVARHLCEQYKDQAEVSAASIRSMLRGVQVERVERTPVQVVVDPIARRRAQIKLNLGTANAEDIATLKANGADPDRLDDITLAGRVLTKLDGLLMSPAAHAGAEARKLLAVRKQVLAGADLREALAAQGISTTMFGERA